MTEDLEPKLAESLAQLQAYAVGDASGVLVEELPIKTAPTYSATDIKKIRQSLHATQRVFAYYLAVSPRTVEAWETGRTTPSGSTRRLIQLIVAKPQILAVLVAQD